MKFGLLVVLAVAVLVPSLSEGRTVSRCELKEKLEQAITLPPQLQKFKEEYLAIVICEVNSRSRLNTNQVKVFGKRTTTVDTLAPRVNGTTAAPTTIQLNTTGTKTTAPTTTRPIPTGATNSTLGTNGTRAGINRRKRDASSEESDPAEMESSEEPSGKKSSLSLGLYGIFKMSEETVGQESSKKSSKAASSEESSKESSKAASSKSDEDEDSDIKDKDSDDKDEDEDEDSDDKDKDSDDKDKDSDDKDEDEDEEGGKRKKRSIEDQSSEESEQSSLGLYGLFQLSDETFCSSGYRSSKNKCNTTCDAFTDDNIMDDIACFVKTDQWRLFLKSASRLCQIGTKNYFDECK
ncbi:uncharacterized protein LOC144530928 [Sander vitreus]